MPKQAVKPKLSSSDAPEPRAVHPSAKLKLPALLVTSDDSLWGEVGSLGSDWVPRQIDSVDELVATVPAGQSGAVLWDARGSAAPTAVISRIQQHSDRLVIIALDHPDGMVGWARAVEKRQVAAHVPLPIAAENLAEALQRAREEIDTRTTLLGHHPVAAKAAPASKKALWVAAILMLACGAAGAAFYLSHRQTATAVSPQAAPPRSQQATDKTAAADYKVDTLIERAQQAMLDRHYLDPAEGSALALYREALILSPSNGEGNQGLQRLAGILIARVQSALDERKFDVALQSLESARSIVPDDGRLAALDERIAGLRSELGTAQIQAALNAQNFDRAAQLIDEATRAKALPAAKLVQLRDEVRRRRDQNDVNRLLTLIDARVQQDRLIDPHNDNAAYYLTQARQSGAPASLLQSSAEEFIKRSVQATRGAIDQHRYADADRFMIELRNNGAPGVTLAGLQHDLTAARSQPAMKKPDQPGFLDLARARLAQGSVLEPDNDSALHYVNELRSTDPENPGLAQITGAVQGQILGRAHTALDGGDTAKAEGLLRVAGTLGTSADLDALNERLLQAKLAATATAPAAGSGIPEVPEASMQRLQSLKPEYPRQALTHNVEGWVEMVYSVTAAGKVTGVKVINSTPRGIFESAAVDAVSHLKYAPYLENGKEIAVTTRIRVAFRLAGG